MYRNLLGIMAMKGVTRRKLAEMAKMPYSTLLDKLSGRTSFTLDEAMSIKALLGTTATLEDIFFTKS